MSILVAFFVVTLVALAILVLLDGYARHMGNPDPTEWGPIVLVALAVGAIGAGAIAVLWEIGKALWGLVA